VSHCVVTIIDPDPDSDPDPDLDETMKPRNQKPETRNQKRETLKPKSS